MKDTSKIARVSADILTEQFRQELPHTPQVNPVINNNAYELPESTVSEVLGKIEAISYDVQRQQLKDKVIRQLVNKLRTLTSMENVTRVEVIDENGRSYTNHHKSNTVELSLQDEQQTLKVFISKM